MNQTPVYTALLLQVGGKLERFPCLQPKLLSTETEMQKKDKHVKV